MKQHFVTPHVADIRLVVEGTTLQELFSAALEGMADIIVSGSCGKRATATMELSVTSFDTTTLLIDFLSDVLTQTHLTRTIFCTANFTDFTPSSLKATLHGYVVDGFEEDIKAVTYHEAEVVKNSRGNYETVIIFDI